MKKEPIRLKKEKNLSSFYLKVNLKFFVCRLI